ncbi:hypothetical protein [Fervidibacillus halotolerans]|uniref:Uncharacterized protein n=1 Tax=Fervidibacillus halotolerans TaxID=2980027 RepID=A0A9E8S1P3_9BACI|nr:hypothetical protein [Fervidibacillus halotolerans]WAA13727.1 hypothetical protein OE105_06400 [Fervidibacillus halotolerans]
MNFQDCLQQLDQLEKELNRLESVLSIQIQANIQDCIHNHQKQIEKVERKLKKEDHEREKGYSFQRKSVV